MNIINSPLMQKEQDPLGLASLPPLDPPEDDWPVIQAALEADRSSRGRMRLWGGIAASVAVTALVIGLVFKAPITIQDLEQPPAVEVASTQLADPSPAGADESVADVDIRESLIALSRQLESQLRGMKNTVGPLSTESLVYQVELEDLIALVDEELSNDPESLDLWTQRVNLMLDINQLYRNQLRRDYHKMASM